MEATIDQKVRLQRALFPEGLRLRDGKIGTAVTCIAFTQLRNIESGKSDLASPRGFAIGYTRDFQGVWRSDRRAA